MEMKVNPLLEEAWRLEDEFTALAGSPTGKFDREYSSALRQTFEDEAEFLVLPEWASSWLTKLKEPNLFWKPVSYFINLCRFSGNETEDLTRDFFLRLPGAIDSNSWAKKHSLRVLLFEALQRFLSELPDEFCLIKGSGKTPEIVSVSQTILKERLKDLDTARDQFDLGWSTAMVEEAQRHMRAEWQLRSEAEMYGKLWEFLAKSPANVSSATISRSLGISKNHAKSLRAWIRTRYNYFFRNAVAETVAQSHEINREVQHLRSVLIVDGAIPGVIPLPLLTTQSLPRKKRGRRLSARRKSGELLERKRRIRTLGKSITRAPGK